MDGDLPKVSEQFLEDSKLDETIQNSQISKRGGPYPKHDRIKRRNEVFKLYFDLGWSTQKIADTMGVNRHTIEDDVKFWFNELSEKWKKVNHDEWVIKQLERFEIQRARLRSKLEEQIPLQERISIEKLLSEIESKETNLKLKLETTNENLTKFIVKTLNETLQKHNLSLRFPNPYELIGIPNEAMKKIRTLIKESKEAIVEIPLLPSSELGRGGSTTYYDKEGRAFGYCLDLSVFFLFDGTALAYIKDESIYSFSGIHLGWHIDDLVWNNFGKIVLFSEDTKSEFQKPSIQEQPVRAPKKEHPPVEERQTLAPKPKLDYSWSVQSPENFFGIMG